MCYHGFDVNHLIEQHQFDRDESVVIGPHVTDITVELRGDMTQLGELVLPRYEATRLAPVLTMPLEFMQPTGNNNEIIIKCSVVYLEHLESEKLLKKTKHLKTI